MSFLAILLLIPRATAFVCDGSLAPYSANKTYIGCYNDSTSAPRILLGAKLSTIDMTPQVCADDCGELGFVYSGIKPGGAFECYCGNPSTIDQSLKVEDSRCNLPCPTDPSISCSNYGLTALYKTSNPKPPPAKNPVRDPFTPVCQTSPLCAQKVCDTSLPINKRIASLVNSLTAKEKIFNLVNSAAGARRIGLPGYEWWNEALHGIGNAPGVHFPQQPNGEYNYATSFGSPILTGATFDDELVHQVGSVIGQEARAFGNAHFAGFDYWTPNINTFRDPRWGRGQETPGEDSFHVQSYTKQFIPGLQGSDPKNKQIIATCKHFAAYDIETARRGNNYNPTPQDLADYYLAPFKTCVRDVGVGSVMCSYNAVNGVPSCASEYLLEEVLREHWKFNADYNYVVADCGAVSYIYTEHKFTNSLAAGAAVALNAGTDLDCGVPGQWGFTSLNASLAEKQTTIANVDRALTRLYSALATVGYFDGNKYSRLSFSDVATPFAEKLAYTAAVEGITLLKNDGLLPLEKFRNAAVIGPYGNATTLLQGNYYGSAKHIVSPLEAFQGRWTVNYVQGAAVNTNDTSGFASAISAAKKSDVIFYFGGIDNSVESEDLDRKTLAWPATQLDLITQLSKLGKPLVVVQFGGGQIDDTPLLKNSKINSILWAGYPGQSGGTAILDIITGKKSPAGRLPVTQYATKYADEVSMYNINLRPDKAQSFPGRTYKWYTGKPVLPFGYGLHYTKFKASWASTIDHSYDIQTLVKRSCRSKTCNDATSFDSVKIKISNVGNQVSDYVGLLFLSSSNAGPEPRPKKSLVSYARLHDIKPKGAKDMELALTLGSLARADEKGNLVIYPGDYKLALDIDEMETFKFSLKGKQVVIDTLPPLASSYNYTVPVHIAPPSTGPYNA